MPIDAMWVLKNENAMEEKCNALEKHVNILFTREDFEQPVRVVISNDKE